jgi:plasmid stability protein
MISIRLSDEEYKALKSRYGKHGARSVSDLARIALQRMLEASSPEDQILQELAAIAVRVQVLESQVAVVVGSQMAAAAM